MRRPRPAPLAMPVPTMLSRVTNSASRSSLQPSVPARAHRQYEKPCFRRRIPDADFGIARQGDAEFGQHAFRVDHRARAIGRRFVPDRRQSQHLPGIAGAQRADDHVMRLRRVLQGDQMRPDRADIAERIGRLAGVFEQARLEVGIGPGARHDAGAVMRADLGLARLDDLVERGGIDIALLGQDGFERPHPQLQVRQIRSRARWEWA